MLSEVFSKASRCVEERTAEQACLFVYGPVPRHKVTKQEKATSHASKLLSRRRNETKRANMYLGTTSPLSVRSTSSTPFDW